MRTFSLAIATIGCSSVVAQAQINILDRNFQRLEYFRTVHKPGLTFAPEQKYNDVNFWQFAPSTSQPDIYRSYTAALSYTNQPHGLMNDQKWQFQSTLGYSWSDVAGGPRRPQMSETMTYQVTKNTNWALTPGLSYAYTDKKTLSANPFVSVTKSITSELSVTPTVTYDYALANETTTTGAVPDIQLGFGPAKLPFLGISADYVIATPVGRNSIQLAALYAFSRIPGASAIKAAAIFQPGARPSYIAQWTIKL